MLATNPQTRLTTGSSAGPPSVNTAATHSSPTPASTRQQSALRCTVLKMSVWMTSRAQGTDAFTMDCTQLAAAAPVGTAALAVAGGGVAGDEPARELRRRRWGNRRGNRPCVRDGDEGEDEEDAMAASGCQTARSVLGKSRAQPRSAQYSCEQR
nr:unnamed protein product [Digitaria exilis]